MKLQNSSQTREEKFNEFDLWITPTLVEIKDTDRYKEELANTQLLLDLIGNETNEFQEYNQFYVSDIVTAILEVANKRALAERTSLIDNTASLLFLVTGKSDNNAKCQFPLFLQQVSHWDQIPFIQKGVVTRKPIPRVLKSTTLASLIAKLKPEVDIQSQFFTEYVKFILDEPEYIKSLWAIGNSYYRMKRLELNEEFLMPLVIFKVRGSVSASGGHEPEELLRNIMHSWGLIAGIDYNTNDVIIGREETDRKTKTRAFDFVLPFNVTDWKPRIFIQCQFYAGDSGSVSHKNVDQTRSSRNFTKTILPDTEPIFIEYLDGAGYYSSLNGDLRSILSMEDTHDFFQVRTAPLKLRRALQEIGYLSPLELVHGLILCDFKLNAAKAFLMSEGYSELEIIRVMQNAQSRKLIDQQNEQIVVDPTFLSVCRLYYLLDLIFNNSVHLDDTHTQRGVILVPGLSGISGVKLSSIADFIEKTGGYFADYYGKSANLLQDLETLSNDGWIIQT